MPIVARTLTGASVALLLVTYVPAFTLTLPKLMD